MRSYLFALCLLCVTLSYSQNPNDRFDDLNTINVKYLEHLTKLKIDSVRNGKGLKPLCNDSILYVAAADHARYLIGKELSHFQSDNENKKTPQKRAEFYGAVNYLTGENIARTVLNKTVSHKLKDQKNKKLTFAVNTYNLAAYSLAVSWVNSPPHYANMITPDYDVTGMSLSIDPNTNVVTAVQKFGNVLYKYNFSNTGSLFPYAATIPSTQEEAIKDHSRVPVRKDYPWKLKPGTPQDFQKVQSLFFDGNTDQMVQEGDEEHLITYKIQAMRKLFRKRRDGFAIELVQYEPFHCGNPDYYQLPSRRNDKYILNGHVLKPVYKKTIMTEFKQQVKEIKKDKKQRVHAIKKAPGLSKEEKKTKIENVNRESDYPTLINTLVGTYTKDIPGGYMERNLIVLQKRRVAYVIHYSSACDTADLTGNVLSLFPKYDQVNISDIINIKKLQFKVPFERNAFEITDEQVGIIRDSINNGLKVKEINIEAWASVEGFEKINLELQQKRALTMRNIIAPLESDSSIKVTIKTGENWEMFYSQIKNTAYHSWARLEKDSIKKLLEDKNNLAAFENFLNAQRKAELKMVYEEAIDVNSSAAMAMGVLRSFIAKIEDFPVRSIDPVTIQAATTMQKYIHERFQKGEISMQQISDIKIPQEKRFIPLLINKLWLDYTYANQEGNKLPADFYRRLSYCAKEKNSGLLARYNYCAFIVNAWKGKPFPGAPSLDDQRNLINELSVLFEKETEFTPVSPEHIDSLKFNFHLKCVRNYGKSASDLKALQSSLNYIYSYYHKQPLSDSMTYVLGSFFNKFQRFDLAKGILQPKVFVENPDLKILSLYLKLTYVHVEEADDMNFYQHVMDSYSKMSPDEWCDLFVGPCNISFQILDHEEFRNFYCEKCGDKGNYATEKR